MLIVADIISGTIDNHDDHFLSYEEPRGSLHAN